MDAEVDVDVGEGRRRSCGVEEGRTPTGRVEEAAEEVGGGAGLFVVG